MSVLFNSRVFYQMSKDNEVIAEVDDASFLWLCIIEKRIFMEMYFRMRPNFPRGW